MYANMYIYTYILVQYYASQNLLLEIILLIKAHPHFSEKMRRRKQLIESI